MTYVWLFSYVIAATWHVIWFPKRTCNITSSIHPFAAQVLSHVTRIRIYMFCAHKFVIHKNEKSGRKDEKVRTEKNCKNLFGWLQWQKFNVHVHVNKDSMGTNMCILNIWYKYTWFHLIKEFLYGWDVITSLSVYSYIPKWVLLFSWDLAINFVYFIVRMQC